MLALVKRLKKQSFLMTCVHRCDIIVRLGQCAGTILICVARGYRHARERVKHERY